MYSRTSAVQSATENLRSDLFNQLSAYCNEYEMKRCSSHQSVYQKLRKKVKNEITRIDKLANLQKMIFRAMIIDNRQYKRRLKKGKESTMSVILS